MTRPASSGSARLTIAASIQATLASGVLRTMTLPGMEGGMRLFHAARDSARETG